jgi:hypothetical protein
MIVASRDERSGDKYRLKTNHAMALASHMEPDDSEEVIVVKLHSVLSNHDNCKHDPYQALCVHATGIIGDQIVRSRPFRE